MSFKDMLNESEQRLGPPEPYDPRNPEHNDPLKYKIFPGSVWDHVLAAIRYNKLEDPLINLAIMMHDIGKITTFGTKENGIPTYFGHAEESVRIVNDIADRLKMSNQERDTLVYAVGNHMRFHDILKMKPSKIAQLVANDNWDCLVAVAKADNFARGDSFFHHADFEKIVNTAIEIKNKWGSKTTEKIMKIVDGNRVMELTGLKTGKKVGEIIKKTTEYVIDNNITSQEEIDNLIMKMYEKLI